MLKPNSIKSVIFVVIQFTILFILFIFGSPFHSIISSIVELTALVFIVWAVYETRLRINIFPDPLKTSKLIVSGPYKLMRHPMYSGLLLLSLSWVIGGFEIWLIILWCVLFLNLLFKAKYEEKLLIKKFGEDYRKYIMRSKYFVPYVF